MTKEKANEILFYVAQELLSPMCTERPAYEVWKELIGEPFSKLCKIVNEGVDKFQKL